MAAASYRLLSTVCGKVLGEIRGAMGMLSAAAIVWGADQPVEGLHPGVRSVTLCPGLRPETLPRFKTRDRMRGFKTQRPRPGNPVADVVALVWRVCAVAIDSVVVALLL